MRSHSWLTGLGLLAVSCASQAFVPSTAARATAAARATGQQQRRLHRHQRSGVELAATRRDVLRMPSSEPMVRERRRGRVGYSQAGLHTHPLSVRSVHCWQSRAPTACSEFASKLVPSSLDNLDPCTGIRTPLFSWSGSWLAAVF